MNQTDYSLIKLWPEFERVWGGDITSPEGLSALIVLVLIGFTAIFAILSIYNYFRSYQHINFYRNMLKGLTADELLEKRREIYNKAKESNKYFNLWREFDESLVHVPVKNRLCNTLDAAHFFNTHTIARGLTENRLLAAVPGFLTAIGVIGTFAGLQMGLSSLSANMGSTPKMDELTVGIFGMIGGASIAFMTSVWGVFTSVVFNFFEKALERNVRSAINSFQNEVDYLYPRITAEQSLSNIEDFSRQSTEKLAELDEKIGNKMQEAMKEASSAIREGMESSLHTILGPAIEKLVDNAHSGSEKALEQLLDRFLEGVGNAGDAQKHMMENAASDVQKASGQMAEGLNTFVGQLETQINSLLEKSSESLQVIQAGISQQLLEQQENDIKRQDAMTTQIERLSSDQASVTERLTDTVGGFLEEQQAREIERQQNLQSQMKVTVSQNADSLKRMQNELKAHLDKQDSRDIERQLQVTESLKGFKENHQQLSDRISELMSHQSEVYKSFMSELDKLLNNLNLLTSRQEQLSNNVELASSSMRQSSNQLGLLSSNVKEAATHLADNITTAVEQTRQLSAQNQDAFKQYQVLGGQLEKINSRIEATAGTLNLASERAESGLTAVDRHFDKLGHSLREHVEQLEIRIASLLNDYSERVQAQTVSRMNTWNEETNKYISSMTDAVRALNDVVDEIDGKLRVTEGSFA